ncbi:MAG TPA: hypothetical protein VJR50_08320, partial [Mycobacterium sp.]|nr:hypothetical protein [Mycobacterium sp.]
MRAAASACLVASGLLISGVGGAIALADPGHGNGRSDDRTESDDRSASDRGSADDSVGDIVRRAFGFGGGDDEKTSNPWQRPDTRWGNGRSEAPGRGESTTRETATDTETQTKTETPSSGTKTPTSKPCPPSETTDPSEPPGNPEPTPPQSFPSSGGGGGATVDLPRYKPPQIPDMQLPGELQPSPPGLPGTPAVLDAGAGVVAAAAPVGPAVPIALPVIVVPPLGIGVGAGAGAGPGAGPR